MAKNTIERKDIPAEERWDLERIYKDTEAWEGDFRAAETELKQIAEAEGHLTDSGETLYKYLKDSESLELKLDDLYVYAKMKLDEDNRVNRYQAMRDRAMGLMVKASEATAFFTPEILAAGEEKINGLIASYEPLKAYHRTFKDLLRFAPHTLNKEAEALLAMTGEMAESPQNTFTMFNEADLKFPEIKDEDGEMIRISHGNFIRLMESKDRAVRKAAFEGLYASYGSYRNTVAATLSGSVKKDVFYAKARNYPSALNEALFADAVDETLYNNLIKAVRDNLDAFQDYLRLRKEVLNVDELHFYDVYTPLVADADRKIPFEEGFDIVKKALSPLGEEYVSLLQQARDDRWIDFRANEGKTSGAYSWGVFNTDPYVLMSYQDNLNSVFTLGHELGHSLHSYYSWHNQPYQYAYYRIFVAEVASTVNETLLADYMLKTAKDDREKPSSSTSIWKNSGAPFTARPCSPNLKRSSTNGRKKRKPSPPTTSAKSTSTSTRITSAPPSFTTTRSLWNGRGFPISTTDSTFINTPPASPRPSIWPTASFPAIRKPWKATFPSSRAAAATTPTNC